MPAREPLQETLATLVDRARGVRVARGFSQGDLARRSGLGIATIQRFERNGHTSLANVVRIAFALGVEAGLERLFEAPAFASLDEALSRPSAPPLRRRRVRRA